MRLLIAFIFFVLTAGSVSTLYPFLIMLGSSVSSLTDFRQYRVVPRFIYDDQALMSKYLDDKYRIEHFDQFKLRYRLKEPYRLPADPDETLRSYGTFLDVEPVLPVFDRESPQFKARVGDWFGFVSSLDNRYKDTFFHYRIPLGDAQVGFQKYLQKKYPTIAEMQVALSDLSTDYVSIDCPFEAYERHTWYLERDRLGLDWTDYRKDLPAWMYNVITIRPLYEKFLQNQYVGIPALNDAWGTHYEYFWEIPFPTSKPSGTAGEDWEKFVRKKMPLRYVRVDAAVARPSYDAFLRAKYRDVKTYNGLFGANAASLEEVPLPEFMPEESLALQVWQEYFEQKLPVEAIVIDSADVRYAEYLAARYKDVSAVNAAYGTKFSSFADADPPWTEADYADLAARKPDMRWNFIARNYVYVIKKVFLQGRPILNTFILVVLSVGTAVTVNPLAAYALARYRLRYGAGILIFMLATMAFPAEVAMIPNFLMIKDLGLLNSFAALILPGLASGYSVFLLKGFFDSLPQELYEAAALDGASEFKMFWVITMPLSLPILSVIALFSFGSAYSSFMWAFTVCQDTKMWTLMVFLQQFQVGMPSHPYVVMASLVVAAIPTIIVFMSAQKVLMKGIVVPTMK